METDNKYGPFEQAGELIERLLIGPDPLCCGSAAAEVLWKTLENPADAREKELAQAALWLLYDLWPDLFTPEQLDRIELPKDVRR